VTAVLISQVPRGSTLITGGARGVDEHARMEGIRLGYRTIRVDAEWEKHGKRAGFMRKIVMLDMEPDLVLAFHCGGSKGTAHTIREAYKQGIPTQVYTEESLRPDIAALDSDDEPITLFGASTSNQTRKQG
jgi:hypothetical protein